MSDQDGLNGFLPVVAAWFRETFGSPTPPQRLGWPAIAAGQSTLLFAPTGSGKTLAAFLACLDHLWRTPRLAPGARILYVSPLKALNQDVFHNLQTPLEGILETARRLGVELPALTVATRSGDTTPADRQKLVRKPPDILITTPESLHLMLTSRARETLRSLSHVIVDEIHALCPNKRGVFLALLLERLEALNPAGFVRVGLSATQRPLDEVARYLGGCRVRSGRGGKTTLEPRPVTIIDTGRRKELDLQVLVPFEQAGPTAPGTTWPAIERKLREMIQAHRSTIVFANNRRVVERLTSRLNELGEDDDGGDDATPQVRSHHGSLSLEERRTTETALKQGELQAVVATASLELGIDMGAVDLVCQVESPGSVARGLQRVGRAGHIVGRVSKGRLIAKTTGDLLESAALCRAMLEGEVEALRIPRGCLDVLAQQVVACVAMDRWDVPDLFNLVRGAYPYSQLAPAAFDSVLRMISGRFPTETFRDLRARVSWDRVHNRLHPLPGTARLAVTSGGTIPDTGQYPVYLGEEGPRLGELDEEFVLERRVGETFVLGTAAWRIEAIEAHRVVVARAEGEAAMMPFWRGEDASRTAELGEAVGALSRELRERLDAPDLAGWLHAHYRLDPTAAETLQRHMARQVRLAGAAPDDRTILIEAFRDPAGELGLAVLTPFGGKLHQALKLALQGRLKERLGISVACLHSDDGILIRLPQTDEPPLNLFEGLTADRAETLIRAELGESALFGLRFRQNAGRALLMPRPDPSKRTPLWLQRLRAKDLLQVVRQFPDFPIVVETYRECLDDDLDLPRLRRLLDQIADGSIQVATHHGEIASPFASDLIFRFTSQFLYQWDEPKRVDRLEGRSAVDDGLLGQLLDPTTHAHWLEPNAVGQVESRLREVGQPPRTSDEMAETLRRLGDLAPSELSGPMLKFLVELQEQGRAVEIELPTTAEPSRWISAEAEPDYLAAFGAGADEDEDESDGGKRAQETIVRRFLSTHALVGLDELLARYPLGPGRATELLEDWEEQGRLIRIEPVDGAGEPRWAERRNLEEVRRLSIALRRRESVAVTPEVFADFVARRQHVHPATRWEGAAAFSQLLEQLIGYAAPAELWESEIWPRRLRDYRPAWLDEALSGGGWSWRAEGEATKGEPRAAFAPRDFPGVWPTTGEPIELSDAETRVLAELERRGASFADDLARTIALEPSRTRLALERLVRLGMVANDRFDPLRPGGSAMTEALARAAAAAGSNRQRRSLGAARTSLRRTASHRPEGRWERLAASTAATKGDGDDEASCLAWAGALLERYGVLARETVASDPWAPPWRELAPWLARAELRGEIRRGYFVEGLSGVQYAAGDTAEELARLAAAAPQPSRDVLLLSTLDPANLYGSGAPLDVNLLEGGTARLPRSTANFLVLLAGRPILIIEAHGKRLTGLASASEAELRSALALVSTLTGPSRRVLKVETYNAVPALQSVAAPWLAELGFVRDYPGMTYYAGW